MKVFPSPPEFVIRRPLNGESLTIAIRARPLIHKAMFATQAAERGILQ
jgi:hypothetical protein